MKQGKRMLLIVVCLLLAAILIPKFVDQWQMRAPETTAQVAFSPYTGGIAPDFELSDYQGKKYHLSTFRGKPVLLNFWASWCGPCRTEMPDLAATGERYQGKVQFVGVNLAGQDSEAVSKALLNRLHVPYPNLLDKEDKVADLYKVSVLPTTLLLDRKGHVIARMQGPLSKKQIEQLLHKVGM